MVILEELASMEYVAGWNHEAFCADRMSCCRQLGRQTDFSSPCQAKTAFNFLLKIKNKI
jgi:hypothetical protein